MEKRGDETGKERGIEKEDKTNEEQKKERE